jgi:laminin gamma 1
VGSLKNATQTPMLDFAFSSLYFEFIFKGKAYDITYVRLKFQSPRPASFAIYKKSRRDPADIDPYPDEGWVPWQFYSATCRDTYLKPDSTSIIQPRDGKTKSKEDRALCTSDFSDMTPLTGANVAFSTLEGRPSAYNFEYSPELQSWVSATDIRISLRRLNTFGDEVFGDPKVLRSYYYGITDFTVGGRC